MTRVSKGDVYIVFGETPVSDGSNIYGVFTNAEKANERVEWLEQFRPWEEYYVEAHELW